MQDALPRELHMGARHKQDIFYDQDFYMDMRDKMEQLANVARFGYGDPDIPSAEDGRHILNKETTRRMAKLPREAYETFLEAVNDSGKSLRGYSDVSSLQELVRLLHSRIYGSTNAFGRDVEDLVRSPFFKDKDGVEGLGYFDVTESGIPLSHRRSLRHGTSATNAVPIVIAGKNYFEGTFPVGKHRMEVATTNSEDPSEYTLTMRHFESGYGEGSKIRLQFVAQVLEKIGFSVSQSDLGRGMLTATFITNTLGVWEKALVHLTKLLSTIPEKDLSYIPPDVAEMFMGGLTHSFWDMANIQMENEGAANSLNSIVRLGMRSEVVYVVKYLCSHMRTFNRDIAPVLSELDYIGLTDVQDVVYELEFDVPKENKKLAPRYARIGKQIENYTKAKFNAPE